MERILKIFIRDYGNVADIKTFYKFEVGNKYSMIQMQDKKSGVYFIVDSEGNAKVDVCGVVGNPNIWQNYISDSTKDIIKALTEWESRAGIEA